MTNEEKIKSMSTEELACLMDSISSDCQECPIHEFCDNLRPTIRRLPFCENVWKNWLKSEVEE